VSSPRTAVNGIDCHLNRIAIILPGFTHANFSIAMIKCCLMLVNMIAFLDFAHAKISNVMMFPLSSRDFWTSLAVVFVDEF